MRVECTLNSYSAQFTFSLISFQHTCDCVYVQGKSTFSQKRSGCVSPRRVAETPLYALPLCQLIYSNGKRKWTRVHPHSSYCHSFSVESCRDYAGDGTVKDHQKHAQVFQVLALVCLLPGSTGTRVELVKALNYLDLTCNIPENTVTVELFLENAYS